MKEALEGFRYDGWELIIDVTGGGVAGLFPRGIMANVAASRLRRLADDLERNVAKRSAVECGCGAVLKHATEPHLCNQSTMETGEARSARASNE